MMDQKAFTENKLIQLKWLYWPLLTILTLNLNPIFHDAKPNILVMSLYFWLVYHPSFVTFVFLALAVVFLDALMGVPIGISGIMYALLSAFMIFQRRYLINRSFIVLWVIFGIVLTLFVCLQSLVLMAFHYTIKMDKIFLQIMMSFLFYPLVSMINFYILKKLSIAGKK